MPQGGLAERSPPRFSTCGTKLADYAFANPPYWTCFPRTMINTAAASSSAMQR